MTFRVTVGRIHIGPHPKGDALEVARVGDHTAVVRKGEFFPGELVAFIPEGALVPRELHAKLNVEGRLVGPDGDRVKRRPIRGVVSEGLCLSARPHWREGDDVAAELGIRPWIVRTPVRLSGQMFHAGAGRCLPYALTPLDGHEGAIPAGEPVVVTEKIEGIGFQVGLMPARLTHPLHGPLVVAPFAEAARGLAIVPDVEANATNLFLRALRATDLAARVDRLLVAPSGEPVFVLCVVFGAEVGRRTYGADAGIDKRIGLRVFDIYRGAPGAGAFANDADLDILCALLNVARVPVVWRGPYDAADVRGLAWGREEVSGHSEHPRAGVVVRPVEEMLHPELGRLQLAVEAPRGRKAP